jgi:hypothetical protein
VQCQHSQHGPGCGRSRRRAVVRARVAFTYEVPSVSTYKIDKKWILQPVQHRSGKEEGTWALGVSLGMGAHAVVPQPAVRPSPRFVGDTQTLAGAKARTRPVRDSSSHWYQVGLWHCGRLSGSTLLQAQDLVPRVVWCRTQAPKSV